MGVSPMSEFLIQINIFPAHIKAAYIGYFIVNDHDFAVIAVIDTKLKPSKQGWEKFRTFDSGLLQSFPAFRGGKPSAHTIVQNSNLHPAGGPFL